MSTIKQACKELKESKYDWYRTENPPPGAEQFFDQDHNDNIIFRLTGPLDKDLLQKIAGQHKCSLKEIMGIPHIVKEKEIVITVNEREIDKPIIVLTPPHSGAYIIDDYLKQKNG